MPRLSKIGAAALGAFGWTSGAAAVTVNYLAVAGGGGGGGMIGGGGGAGGYQTGTTSLNPTLSYTVTVGAGGAATASSVYIEGNQGNNSSFSTITANGGGKGGSPFVSTDTSGGSSGGAGGFGSRTGTASQGNLGGTTGWSGAGGGGAGGVGANTANSNTNGGAGGVGLANPITGSTIGQLVSGTYYIAGGGGGGSYRASGGVGGDGGGGAGGAFAGGIGVSGTSNTGGGGGGGGDNPPGAGGAGGSGVVIISYVGAQQFGGGVVTSSGGNTIHTFTTSGTLSPLSSLTASALIVAGGGGGSYDRGGGGGAGGLQTPTGLTIDTNSIYVVTVGSGGAGATTNANGTNGTNSTFSIFSTASVGGGGGASYVTAGGSAGGSGGGGSYTNTGGAGTSGQGNAGGNGESSVYINGGGGGGAGAAGQTPANSSNGGNGGNGSASSISGTSVTYAGGGGGGHDTRAGGSAGTGGTGGGGAGGMTGAGTAGTANLGGGGGGGGNNGGSSPQNGGAGGSGVVIISYPGSTQQMAGGTVTVAGGNVIHTFTSSGYLTPIVLVNNSLRFRESASSYLNRTPTTAGNRQKFTLSVWYKPGNIGTSFTNANFLSAGGDGSNIIIAGAGAFGSTVENRFVVRENNATSQFYWPMVFRDPAAWYHIVLAVDTTQATSANRAKLYVNGVDQGAFSGTGYSQNDSTSFNSVTTHYIGAFNSSFYYTSCYFAEYTWIDGQQLTANSFGSFNGLGVWQPIRYGGSYGTNGFYLPFSNTTSTTALGFDFSPQGNNWTPNNISSTTSPTTVQVFNSSSTWTAPAGVSSVNYLVVGAGGGGGNLAGGGGGAGGYRASTLSVAPGTTYTVTIGAGGASATQGGNSVFSSITSTGGGAGGLYDGGTGGTGGSGGGGAGTSGTTGSSAGGAATSGQGSAGGGATATISGGAGGGGAGAGGSSTGSGSGANGGNGSSSSSITGSTYAGGGGGGNRAFDAGTGGSGGSGGGGGGAGTNRLTPADGTVNTGGGGGGGGFGTSISSTGASGGSGIVVLSYTVDSMTDVPTNTNSNTANYCVLNPLDTAVLTSSNGNLTASSATAAWNTMRCTIGVSSGKWYWEYATSSNNSAMVGIETQSASLTTYIGNTSTGYAYNAADGNKYNNGSSAAYGATYTSGDIIGVAFDADAGTLTFYKNGSSQGTAYSSIPAGTYFPAVSIYAGSGTVTNTVNFGQRPFSYTPPTGFLQLNTFNLPTPTIGATASTTANKYMDVTLWAGNSGTQSIINSGSMPSDLVWIKNRTGGNNHALFDSVRGATLRLYPDTTLDEQTETTTLTAFNSNGFSLGSAPAVNASSNNYVGWQWRAGGTPAVTNTAGSITSTVSANTTAGFSIVTWTGNGASSATIGHGLGVAPSMIIVKNRSATWGWFVYNKFLTNPNTGRLQLNLTNGEIAGGTPGPWNNTAPTSTVFSLGDSTFPEVNGSGNLIVAYCFAPIAGYSAFGSYTGNGSTDGPFVYLGFRPRFVMIKRTTSADSWIIHDTARDIYNGYSVQLYPNSSSAEGGPYSPPILDELSNGFKCRSSASGTNGSGDTFIYMAFAENPFKYANAR